MKYLYIYIYITSAAAHRSSQDRTVYTLPQTHRAALGTCLALALSECCSSRRDVPSARRSQDACDLSMSRCGPPVGRWIQKSSLEPVETEINTRKSLATWIRYPLPPPYHLPAGPKETCLICLIVFVVAPDLVTFNAFIYIYIYTYTAAATFTRLRAAPTDRAPAVLTITAGAYWILSTFLSNGQGTKHANV